MTDTFHPRRPPTPGALRGQSEMRLATAMVVDMVDSTKMSDRLGPEASFLFLDKLLGMARGVVEDHGGVMVEELGDGFFALFGAPVSIDRAALAASRAGLDICRAVEAEAPAFTAEFGLAPKLRVGLAAGEVLLTGSEAQGKLRAAGPTVNLAARLQTLAAPNGVVCAQSVRLETEGWVQLDPMGPAELKGFSEPVETFALRAILTADDTPADASRVQAEFVGRQSEIAQLIGWQDDAGDARPVSLIVGEAGIGKSRLMGEFAERSDRRMILGACHPTTTARPLAPIIDSLRSFAGWRPDGDPDALAEGLKPILPDKAEQAALVVKLATGQAAPDAKADASDGFALRRALIAALTELGCRPDCLLCFEDLHWIDPLSFDVLSALVAADAPGMRLLGTTRPVDWLNRLPDTPVLRIDTGPMQAPEIAAIASRVLGSTADDTLVAEVARSSEGNPFFATEILHNVAAQGAHVEAARIGTIQNIALARFDRIDERCKSLLRMASVQGRAFRFDALYASAEGAAEGAFGDTDALMQAAEGIVEPDPTDPSGSARFRHILLREAIYATIPPTVRPERHLDVARALETCAGDDAPRMADALADHFEAGGDARSAVKYLRMAAATAYRLYALDSCRALMDRAFALIEADETAFSTETLEDAVSLHLRCLDVMDQFRAAIAVSEAWLPRLRTPDGSPTLALLLALTAKAYCHMGNYERSHALLTEALEMATRLGSDAGIAYAKVALMRVLSDSGRGSLADIEALFEDTRSYTEALSDGTLYANRMFHMMSAYRTQGRMGRAIALSAETRAFGERHNHHHVRLLADWNTALQQIVTNDVAAGLALADAGLHKADPGSSIWEVFMLLKLSAQVILGRPTPPDAIEKILKSSDKRGEYTTRNSAATQLGYALCADGQIWRGWRQLKASDDWIRPTSQVVLRHFLLLHRAEFLLLVTGLEKGNGPPPKMGLKDMAMAITLRLTGRRRAKALLQRLLDQLGHEDGFFVARAQAALAVLAAAEGRAEAARDSFDRAERLFSQEGLEAELQRLHRLRTEAGIGPG